MEPNPANKFQFLIGGFFLVVLLCKGAAGVTSRTHMFLTCNGSIAECDKEGELLMESDISRRILEEGHISYSTLKKDQPACGSAGRGEPYRSCYPDPSNPYSRGCSKIYRCRDDS